MVNAGLKFVLYNETETGMEMFEYYYENGIVDYVKETVGDDSFTTVETWDMEREGRDRADKEDHRMKCKLHSVSQTKSICLNIITIQVTLNTAVHPIRR